MMLPSPSTNTDTNFENFLILHMLSCLGGYDRSSINVLDITPRCVVGSVHSRHWGIHYVCEKHSTSRFRQVAASESAQDLCFEKRGLDWTKQHELWDVAERRVDVLPAAAPAFG